MLLEGVTVNVYNPVTTRDENKISDNYQNGNFNINLFNNSVTIKMQTLHRITHAAIVIENEVDFNNHFWLDVNDARISRQIQKKKSCKFIELVHATLFGEDISIHFQHCKCLSGRLQTLAYSLIFFFLPRKSNFAKFAFFIISVNGKTKVL